MRSDQLLLSGFSFFGRLRFASFASGLIALESPVPVRLPVLLGQWCSLCLSLISARCEGSLSIAEIRGFSPSLSPGCRVGAGSHGGSAEAGADGFPFGGFSAAAYQPERIDSGCWWMPPAVISFRGVGWPGGSTGSPPRCIQDSRLRCVMASATPYLRGLMVRAWSWRATVPGSPARGVARRIAPPG